MALMSKPREWWPAVPVRARKIVAGIGGAVAMGMVLGLQLMMAEYGPAVLAGPVGLEWVLQLLVGNGAGGGATELKWVLVGERGQWYSRVLVGAGYCASEN